MMYIIFKKIFGTTLEVDDLCYYTDQGNPSGKGHRIRMTSQYILGANLKPNCQVTGGPIHFWGNCHCL